MKLTAVKINFPAQVAKFINNETSVEFEGDRVVDLIDALDQKYGNFKQRLFEDDGRQVRPYFNFFIGKKNINMLDGIYTAIPEGETVSILLARAGG
jgi:molybdopterin converting factor small subunit